MTLREYALVDNEGVVRNIVTASKPLSDIQTIFPKYIG